MQWSLFLFWPNRPNVNERSEARPISWWEYYEKLAAISLPEDFLDRERAVQVCEKHSFGPNFWEGLSVVNQVLEKREKRTIQVDTPVQEDPWSNFPSSGPVRVVPRGTPPDPTFWTHPERHHPPSLHSDFPPLQGRSPMVGMHGMSLLVENNGESWSAGI
jgi:hypothetical protein